MGDPSVNKIIELRVDTGYEDILKRKHVDFVANDAELLKTFKWSIEKCEASTENLHNSTVI